MSLISRVFMGAAMAAACSISGSAFAGTITFTQTFNPDLSGMVDVFVTPTAGSEFTNIDVRALASTGTLLDPVRNQAANAGNFDDVTNGPRVDTWINTPFSSLGAGPPSYIFTVYHPGAPPFIMPTPGPIVALDWSVFDTNTGDVAELGPYHLGRILFSPLGTGTIEILTFDTLNAGSIPPGDNASFAYGIPEPGSLALAGLAAVAGLGLRRKK